MLDFLVILLAMLFGLLIHYAVAAALVALAGLLGVSSGLPFLLTTLIVGTILLLLRTVL